MGLRGALPRQLPVCWRAAGTGWEVCRLASRAGLEPIHKPRIGPRVVHASSPWLARERGPDFLGSESRREFPLHDGYGGYGGVLVQQSAPRHQRAALGSLGPVRCCRWPSTGWEQELEGPSLCALVDGFRASAFGSN